MVLSWNKDLDIFVFLIEFVVLDIYVYIILVNNWKYGDSCVCLFVKESFLCDIVRVRGGENDFVVVVILDIKVLRLF